MAKDTSGPAFPSPEYSNPAGDWMAGPFFGMTLRQYFAAHAPQPTEDEIKAEMEVDRLANPHNEPYFNKKQRRSRLEIICDLRYAYADAMLAHEANEAEGER